MQILCFDATFSLIRGILRESFLYGVVLLIFILIAAFTVLNMLIGVICEIVSSTNQEEREKLMRDKVKDLFHRLDTDGSGNISRFELARPEATRQLERVGIDQELLHNAIGIVQPGDRGDIAMEEFLELIFKLLHPPETQDILLIKRKLEKLEQALTSLRRGTASKRAALDGDIGGKLDDLEQQIADMGHRISAHIPVPRRNEVSPHCMKLQRLDEGTVQITHLLGAIHGL